MVAEERGNMDSLPVDVCAERRGSHLPVKQVKAI